MNEHGDSSLLDKFERAREALWGTPGFQRRNSTVISSGWSFFPQGTWVVETIKTDETQAIFLQLIDKDGGQRIVLPKKVCDSIYRQRDSILKIRRKVRAQRGVATRKARQCQ